MTLRLVASHDLAEGAAVVADVRRRCVAAGEQDPLNEAATLRLKHHGLERAALWLAGGDGFAFIHDHGVEQGVDLAVAPDHRGRGVGRALAERSLGAPHPVSAWSHGDHPAAAHLAAAYGLRRARELWVMRRPTSRPVDPVQPPEGVTIRSFRPTDRMELVILNAAAFASHPEQGVMNLAELGERMGEEWFDPAGLLVADDGTGRLLGFHWTKRHSPELAEVYVVGIDPVAQGAGLGRALVAAGLEHLADRGATEIMLYVEADNLGGRALYEGLGFTHAAADTHVQYQRR